MAWQWIVGALVALGGLVFTVAKADLEDVDVYRWLARKLIDRAAQRLPYGERDRWRDESTQNVLDLPGRLPPVLWALDTYVRSGSWGRMRGAPSRSEAMKARLRAAWHKLRSRPEAPPQEPQPEPAAARAEAEPAIAAATAESASVLLGQAKGRVFREPTRQPRPIRWPRSHYEFLEELAKGQREFEEWADGKQREFEEWADRARQEFEGRAASW